MDVKFSSFFILIGLTGIHGITTVSKVSVRRGGSIYIPCLYGQQYRDHVKYLCEGYYWNSCSYAVKTNQQNSPKYSISDNKDQSIFSVTIKSLTTNNKYYWCAVEINRGADVREFFELITSGKQSLYVDEQLIKAFHGDNTTINCKHDVAGTFKWCKLGNSCLTGSGSIAGTKVTITTEKTVSIVHMSGLRIESSGWYWCVKGDLQMPVHLTVTERPTTSQTPTTVEGEQGTSEVRKPDYLINLIIPLVVLVFIVLGTLFIWFMLKRHKQMQVQSSPTAEEDVAYTAVKIKRKTTKQAKDEVLYGNITNLGKSSGKKSNTEIRNDDEVMYSTVVAVGLETEKRVKAKAEDVTYSTLAPHQ